jgi:hypothetical protein
MCNRTFAASFIAVLLIAWMFTPVEATARGGFARIGAPFALKVGVHRFHGALRHRGLHRHGLLRYGVLASSGGIAVVDNPAGYVRPGDGFDRPAQRVCFAQVHTVPSETGGLRDVTVRRCFKE